MLLFLFNQWFSDNLENKQFPCHPGYHTARAESVHSFNVLKYELSLNVPMTSRAVQGINKITCVSREDNLKNIILHQKTLNIDSVMVDNTAVTFSTPGESLLIDLPHSYNSNDTFYLEIGYHGSWDVTDRQLGFVYFPRGYDTHTLHSIAYTLGEPWDARAWMPCYDEPYDKADLGCIISITTPDTFAVCANGQLIDVHNNPDHAKTYTWQENYPISTYLMHFGVSRYAIWSDWYHPRTGDSVEIRHFVWPEDSAQSVISFQYLPRAMALFDSMYGSYPFTRYGQDAVYPFAWGGMEHQEMTTIHRRWVINQSEIGMAHELAHQWWGDMVTCVDFRDIWLNEGFASYSDANYSWLRFGHQNFINIMQDRAREYFQSDARWRHPVYDPPAGQLFDSGHTYYKGSWILHMLRYLDEDSYFQSLHVYRDSFEYKTASTEDLKNICSAVYGTDLTWFFDEWVYDQGYPEYEIYWLCQPSGGRYITRINIYQTQTNAPSVFHMPVEIMLHTAKVDTLVKIPINTSPEHIQFTTADSVKNIDFDPNHWLLMKYQIFVGIEEVVADHPIYNEILPSSNPCRNGQVRYSINQSGPVEIVVYDISGRAVKRLKYKRIKSGIYSLDLSQLNSGAYFIRLKTRVSDKKIKLVVLN